MKLGKECEERKAKARETTSWLFLELVLSETIILFYDESTFANKDFSRKVWVNSKQEDLLQIEHPTFTWKLNAVFSRQKLIAFCLSEKSWKGVDVHRFLFCVLSEELRRLPRESRIHLVLDNATKNRTDDVMSIPEQIPVSLLFIAPNLNKIIQ